MKCKRCGKKAAIRLRSYGLSLCEEHFTEFFIKRVRESIRRYKMLGRNEKVLAAISGGKDSMVLWDVLNKLGYETTALFIDLGIKGFSERARETVEKFAEKTGYKLIIFDLKKELGFSIPDVKKKEKRNICAACGLVKRYVMNKVALDRGLTLATGHNLNDETASLLSNVLSWQIGYLARQAPVLPARDGLAKRIKPLCELTERETAAYAIISGIDFFSEECPFSKGATSIIYKRALNLIEYRSAGTKLRFYREFLKNKDIFKSEEKLEICECGYPTTHPPCAFCRLKSRMTENA